MGEAALDALQAEHLAYRCSGGSAPGPSASPGARRTWGSDDRWGTWGPERALVGSRPTNLVLRHNFLASTLGKHASHT